MKNEHIKAHAFTTMTRSQHNSTTHAGRVAANQGDIHMDRTSCLIQRFISSVSSVTFFLVILAFLVGAPRAVHATEQCHGGSVIFNSDHRIVGCAFSTWGSDEQLLCNGATVFAPANSGPGTCHICAIPPYDAQVAARDFTGLTLQSNAGSSGPTSFTCLTCAQPPSGLTAWWTIDDAATGRVSDLTGNIGNDGVLVNSPQVVPGQVGSALKFNGIDQSVQIPDDPQLNIPAAAADGSGDFSIDAWVKLDPGSDHSGVRVIVEKRTFSSPNHLKGYSFYLYNRYLGVQLADDGSSAASSTVGYTNYGAPTLVVPEDGQWHFVAATVSRANSFAVQFTMDDKPMVVVSSPVRNGSLTNPSPLRIGMLTISNGSVFNGAIDEVEFFRSAVIYADWQAIYQAKCNGKCRPQ